MEAVVQELQAGVVEARARILALEQSIGDLRDRNAMQALAMGNAEVIGRSEGEIGRDGESQRHIGVQGHHGNAHVPRWGQRKLQGMAYQIWQHHDTGSTRDPRDIESTGEQTGRGMDRRDV